MPDILGPYGVVGSLDVCEAAVLNTTGCGIVLLVRIKVPKVTNPAALA